MKGKQVARLERGTTAELQAQYARACGRVTQSRNRRYLVRQIAMAQEEAAWAEAARPTVTVKVPAEFGKAPIHSRGEGAAQHVRDSRLPAPGTILTKKYRGTTVSVTVGTHDFTWQGESYRTLSAVAKAASGTHVNGYRWFGLTEDAR